MDRRGPIRQTLEVLSMRSHLPPRALTKVLVVAILASVVVAPVAQAQDGFCALFTPQEVKEVYGDRVIAEPSFEGCDWHSDDGKGPFVFVSARWDDRSMADRQEATSGTSLTVAGRDAWYADEYFALYVQLDQGLLVISGRAPKGDTQPLLQQLGEIAVGRASQLPLPPEADPATVAEPVPPSTSDAELAALFPTSIAGEAVSVQTMAGDEISFATDVPEASSQLEALLAAQGITLDDVVVGVALTPTASIIAYQFAGADAAAFMDLVVSLAGGDGVAEAGSVAGKDVTVVALPTATRYIYPRGDIIWGVAAEDPVLTEIFEALP